MKAKHSSVGNHSSDTGRGVSRRHLLQGTAATLATISVVPRHVLGGPGQTPPSEKLVLAGIGVGGVGHGQLAACERAGFHIAVLCDVDQVYAKRSFDRWPKARRYRDFREMLDAEADKIDAVYVGTPDHSHAVICMAALRKKKHLCCVKPLTRTIHECRTVVDAAVRAGVATQVTASPNTTDRACRTCELIQAGAIGTVREVHIWSNRPLWPQGMLPPNGADKVPPTLDWDLWLGPATERPFVAEWPEGHYVLAQVNAGRPRRAVYHPWNFRGWWDFGTGALGDMGCHHLNTPYRALGLTHPTCVFATATKVFDQTAPLASIVTYGFPARGDRPPVRVVWYDGGLQPPAPKALEGRPLPRGGGELYIGEEGVMLRDQVFPESRAKKFANVPKTLPRRSGTWGEWWEACHGGEKAGCHFEWAGLLTEFVLLGNIAIRTGKPIQWDATQMRVTNVPEANKFIQEPYRSGWTL
ncbi:MAG: Gfo/Idh/MocA family oxidoreductase [Planctomycetes bacterium]|nr:Gfo/Idh/MocA family oxidoreductase [Planctomycetota bacterium]